MTRGHMYQKVLVSLGKSDPGELVGVVEEEKAKYWKTIRMPKTNVRMTKRGM